MNRYFTFPSVAAPFFLYIFLSGLFCIFPVAAASSVTPHQIDSVLSLLDTEIGNREAYDTAKKNRLASLRLKLNHTTSGDSRFDLYRAIYDEYKNFQFDSLCAYAGRMRDVAIQNGNPAQLAVSYVALLEGYTSVGFFKEAAETDQLIDVDALPENVHAYYYALKARLYQNLESFVGRDSQLGVSYAHHREECYDKVLQLTPAGCYEHDHAAIEKDQIWRYIPDIVIRRFTLLLDSYPSDNHQKAVTYSLLAKASIGLGDMDAAIYYAALSAIHDIRSSTRETTAAKDLASLLQQRGDLDRASRYIHLALDDAKAYNTRIRQIEINAILPSIESSRYYFVRNKLVFRTYAVVLFVAVALLLFYMYIKLKRRSRQLAESNEIIRSKSEELDHINESLSNLNAHLQEVNDIKDRYIIETIKANQYVNEVAEMSKSAIRALNERKYDDLKRYLYDMGIKKEWERLFSTFDSAFMKLFPNFIDEYNKLFPAEHRVTLNSAGELSTEMRIFALMRLGIDDPIEVAKYLNLSTNTVYVYKAKVKSKSLVPKNEFDDRIMAIPKP